MELIFLQLARGRGINIGGYKEPLFVIGIDIGNNLLFVGEGQSHPGLYRKGLFIRNDEVHWIRTDLEMELNEARDYDVRIRYRQPLQKARLYSKRGMAYISYLTSYREV